MAGQSVVARGLGQVFDEGGSRTRVLGGVDVELRPGEMVAVVGPSGSGKSTLLHILGLLAPPTEGSYLLDGRDTAALTRAERAATRLEKISFVFQAFHLVEHKTVMANVELPLKYLGVKKHERRALAERMLNRLGLSHRRDAMPRTLSGGEKQRVAIARALVTNPKLLLCDEPTGSLDSRRSGEVMHMLRAMTGPQQTTVIVTHDPWVASQCDRSLTLDDGRLFESSPPTDAEANPVESGTRTFEGSERGSHEPDTVGAGAGIQTPIREPNAKNLSTFRSGVVEAAEAVIRRARRNLLTTLGVTLGVATLVLTTGLTSTIAGQLSDAFNVFKAQRIVLNQTAQAPLTSEEAVDLARGEGIKRLGKLNGVTSTAVIRPLTTSVETVTPAPETRQDFEGRVQAPVLAATPSIFVAQGQEVTDGRTFDEGHMDRKDRVAVVGRSLLENLGIPWTSGLTLFVGGQPLTVVGVTTENPSLSDYHGAVYVPLGVSLDGHDGGRTSVVLATAPGAAPQVGREAPMALSPHQPVLFAASVPAEPETLRRAVDQQQRSLLLTLSAVTLLIGTVGIMNTFLVAVLERRKEIGLRLALGNRARGIMVQFAAEAMLTSAVGAVAGVVVALDAIATISVVNHWQPIVSAGTVAWGLAAGLVVGLVAGAYPAWKAGRIDPVETLMHS
ncbi:ABC transporter ATP-binding protein/permease [Rothia uropygialis]|uniref:ABC transporter ATP-binding protein/permease n=1 Tax=Kocuria sp. 36 TaxID=1415402 RepID=UPI00101CF0AA|nr:ATP-binding cassette domain-containing protein [Kocuria sp. 36]